MSDFEVHDHDTAPAGGTDALARAEKAFGFAPNLVRVLAEAPEAAQAYLDLGERFSASSLSPGEEQVVLLTTSFENGCDYCMAAHSAVAGMVGIAGETLEALRSGGALPEARLEALRAFTAAVVQSRGRPSADQVKRFLEAGFGRAQVLEVMLGVAMKTLSNYTNHVAGTPLDEAFEAQRWTPPAGDGNGHA